MSGRGAGPCSGIGKGSCVAPEPNGGDSPLVDGGPKGPVASCPDDEIVIESISEEQRKRLLNLGPRGNIN